MGRLWIPAVLILAAFAALFSMQRMNRKVDHPNAVGLARRLINSQGFEWRMQQFQHGHIHFLPNSHAAATTNTLIAAVDSARSQVLDFFALQDNREPVELFFVDSREQMRRLVGRPIGGMVQSGERTAIFVYNEAYQPFLAHELTHLYTHYHWGPPRQGRWISEGAAMLASGDCQGHSIRELASGLLHDDKVVAWRDFARDFDKLNEIPANIQAAAIVQFVRGQLGIKGVRELWGTPGFGFLESTMYQPVDSLEHRWRAALSDTPPARLDTVRLHKHGCIE